jgi:pilus assembly protein Flp/PilA
MTQFLRRFISDNKGIAALEYALIAGLMFALIVAGVGTMGTKLTNVFNNIGTTLTSHSLGS